MRRSPTDRIGASTSAWQHEWQDEMTRLRSVPSSQAPRSAADETAAATLHDLHRGRFSCRAYRPEPVPRGPTARILALAARPPAWLNGPPWPTSEGRRVGARGWRDV